MARTIKYTLRVTEQEREHVEHVTKERGYLNSTAFIRAAVRNALNGQEKEMTAAEERLTATLERISQDIIRCNRSVQALFAVLDTLVKTFLTCVPEPPENGMSQSVARARGRYSRFIQSAGQGMAGDSRTSLSELVDRVER